MNLLKRLEGISEKTGVSKFPVVGKLGKGLIGVFLPREVEIKVGDISHMIISPKKDTYYLLGFDKHEAGVTRIIQENLHPGDTFIDVGAYIGFYSIIVRECIGSEGKEVAFEPYPESFNELAKNLALNNYENVVVENKALLDKTERIRLFLASDLSTPSIVKLLKEDSIEVKAISFDEYAEIYDLTPNMTKIDAEGAEFRILKGMWKTIEKYHPAIICEVHPLHLKGQGIDLKTLFEFYKSETIGFS